jgi:glycosyltransferase involved in cell wall biosynthesis
MREEFNRAGINIAEATVYDESYWAREEEEYALADLHCVASGIVFEQLVARRIPKEKIWIVPYGASSRIFFPPPEKRRDSFRILFAGQLSLRKGVRTLLGSLRYAKKSNWRVDFFGSIGGEVRKDLMRYDGTVPVQFHGAVSQSKLAEVMRQSSVLVLPSLEEGFGMVVAQALACGTPCIVSDRVGAKDLIVHRENGSIFPVGECEALAEELRFWALQETVVRGDYSWRRPAQQLISLSQKAVVARKGTSVW